MGRQEHFCGELEPHGYQKSQAENGCFADRLAPRGLSEERREKPQPEAEVDS
jgi:hypothetical protein